MAYKLRQNCPTENVPEEEIKWEGRGEGVELVIDDIWEADSNEMGRMEESKRDVYVQLIDLGPV